MSGPRLATIPFEHVEAELAAFPLASEASFKLGATSLSPLLGSNALWRAAEKELMETLPSFPLDEAATIRDKLWFNSSTIQEERQSLAQKLAEPVSLLDHLRRLAGSYLDSNGRPIDESTVADAKSGRAGSEARLRWSWMCQALPPDLLRTARGIIDADADPFPLNPVLSQILRDGGFAESHLHLGAAIDFPLLWAALMRALTRTDATHSDFLSAGAGFEEGRDLCTWILHAAVLRLVLGKWLFEGSHSSSSLSDLLHVSCGSGDQINSIEPNFNEAQQPAVRNTKLDIVERTRLASLISELRRGEWNKTFSPKLATVAKEQLDRRFAQTRAIYRRLIQPPALYDRGVELPALWNSREPQSRQEVFASDPLARIVGWRPNDGTSPESVFVAAALSEIEHGDKESDFAALFWQVIRIRCLLYRHVVQRPLTPGMQWFVRFFSRIKPMRVNIPGLVLARTAARISGSDRGLRSLEVRVGTDESESACLEKVRDLEKSAVLRGKRSTFLYYRPRFNNETIQAEEHTTDALEVGALFHFSRKRGGGWESGNPNAYGLDHSCPAILRTGPSTRRRDAGNPTGFRFARFYLEQRRHAQALVSLFEKYPSALRTVRGVDLCTDEAGVPIWVMAPLVRWVRDAGYKAILTLNRRGNFSIPPPRTSVHAGEDFVHLLSGLRRLDEAITYLDLQEGDRLGHALALGVDPSIWCSRVGRVVQIREERLFDLVWEWSCYAKYGVAAATGRLAYLRNEIVRLARVIFGRFCPPEELMSFIARLHQEQELRAQGFPDRSALFSNLDENHLTQSESRSRRRLLRAYLREESVWRQGRVPETIDLRNLRHEQAALSQLQEGLRSRVGKLCLTVEVNPSSNLLIGDLGNFQEHPLWRLRPAIPEKGITPLSICIGSDDPLTFATSLPHEYQLLFDALILGEHSHEVATEWINEVRSTGMRSRFTLVANFAQLSNELKVPNLLGWERPQSPP